jgi:hypothetical protein
MARKRDAGPVRGPEGGVEVGLGAAFVVDELGSDAVAGEVIGDEMDEVQVGVPVRSRLESRLVVSKPTRRSIMSMGS